MDNVIGSLRVYFDDPFWVGLFELYSDGKLSVCKVTFGAEPKDGEVYEFILRSYFRLNFSPEVEAKAKKTKSNPKRIQRDVRKVSTGFCGTKSQQALKLQREQLKTERRELSREQKDAEKLRRFDLKRQKKKEKHRGR